MNQANWLSEQFEANRGYLQSMATRLLGSPTEAEDAVQETWLRLHRSGGEGIANLRAWLTTVVARVCLDSLRSRSSRREDELPGDDAAPLPEPSPNVEADLALSESVGLAVLVVLEKLAPAERVAFVLHDLFGVPFEDIARTLGRSPDAARKLASRARHRVRGGDPSAPNLAQNREVVEAFLRALRAGDMEGLVAVLDPEVVVQVDTTRQIRGARTWAKGAVAFAAMAHNVEAALVDGQVGAIFAPEGKLSRALKFTFSEGRISRVEILTSPEEVAALEVKAF
jgi:RNA polymerase sigma factor (sigma-70 family)